MNQTVKISYQDMINKNKLSSLNKNIFKNVVTPTM